MEKFNPWYVGSAMTLTAAVASLVCITAVYISLDGMINFMNAWVHGLDLVVLKSDKAWTLGGFAYGLFGVASAGFLGGVLFACSYNLVSKCSVCL